MTKSHATYTHECTIRFDQADPAGIMFFGQVFFLAHEAFEKFVISTGFSWEEWFANSKWGTPIRHSEANFQRPMRPGKSYQINVTVARLGESSMTIRYVFMRDAHVHCEVQIVHTFIDIKEITKMPIPTEVRTRLAKFAETTK